MVVIPFKASSRTTLAIHKETFRFVFYNDKDFGGLKINSDATAKGKQNPALRGMRVMMFYKAHMHSESSLSPDGCTTKSYAIAKHI
jgi:hypothetical protein